MWLLCEWMGIAHWGFHGIVFWVMHWDSMDLHWGLLIGNAMEVFLGCLIGMSTCAAHGIDVGVLHGNANEVPYG